MKTAVFSAALLCLIVGCTGFRDYADLIPNGQRVLHPCKDNVLWHGVGHLNVQGGGSRNVFGNDFAAAGHTWTRQLCLKDSDGDGESNGAELGDPECIWTPGNVPQSTTSIRHPGICDPFRSANCSSKSVPTAPGATFATQSEWMEEACVAAEFDCPAVEDAGVQELDLRMPQTPVPAQETTYMCFSFNWPDVSKDVHVIATEPIINNSYVMHHMLLYGCPDDFRDLEAPQQCGMGGCPDLIGAWALGVTGVCFHQDAGVLLGKSGYKKLMIQYHWNNPRRHDNFVDSSGMKLYYTTRLRPNNMAVLVTGQNFIQIPPRSPHTLATSDCSSTCTRNLMTDDIHITAAANHMHYLGKAMNIELHRDGKFVMNLTNDVIYDYDTPKFHEYPDPVIIKPGDMIRTNCHFASPDKTVTTFKGDATSDEMCFGFFSFYPRENMPHSLRCTSWRGFSTCDPATFGECSNVDRWLFGKPAFNQTEAFIRVTSACLQYGPCKTECKEALKQAMAGPCLGNEDIWRMIRWYYLPKTEAGRQFLGALATCEVELYIDSLGGSGNNIQSTTESANEAASVLKSMSFVTILGSVFGTLYLVFHR